MSAPRRGAVRRIQDDGAAAGASAPSRGGFLSHVVGRIGSATATASRIATRLAPYVGIAVDYAWFAGTTAVLLSLPILIEIQRETTVLVMQRQREAEMAQMQEQARMAQGGFVEQMKGLGALVTGSAPGAPGGGGGSGQ